MTIAATGSRGITRCRFWCSSLRLRVSRSAPQSTSANFAASAGWIRNEPPTSIQFWLPLTLTPIPGTSTSTSSTTDSTRMGTARRRNHVVGSRLATTSAGTPSTTHIA